MPYNGVMSLGPRRRLALILFIAGAVGLLGGFLVSQAIPGRPGERPDIPGLLWPHPKALGPFSLVDQQERPFDLERLKGRWTFLFFGYTHCPDVCPLTLTALDRVEKHLAQSHDANLDGVQFAFVTVDPQRDTPKKVAQYVQYFNKAFLGISGPEDKLAALTRQLGVIHMRTDADTRGDYLVDHTASIMLTDPQARLVGVFGPPHDAKTIAEQFTKIRRFIEG